MYIRKNLDVFSVISDVLLIEKYWCLFEKSIYIFYNLVMYIWKMIFDYTSQDYRIYIKIFRIYIKIIDLNQSFFRIYITRFSILPRLLQLKIKGMPRSLFYDIPYYVKMIPIYPFGTMWRNPCIWSSKSCQLHVDFTFQMWCWPCIFRISMQEIKIRWSVAVPS